MASRGLPKISAAIIEGIASIRRIRARRPRGLSRVWRERFTKALVVTSLLGLLPARSEAATSALLRLIRPGSAGITLPAQAPQAPTPPSRHETIGARKAAQEAVASYDVLHSFAGSDGANPYAGLIQATDGNFYGTTSVGGIWATGTVFKMDASGNITTLHSFAGSDGANPYAGLIQATDGNFYGTTFGGAGGYGTVFKMDASGNLTTLHSFAGSDGGDGANPSECLIQATDGNFYGTTRQGGAIGSGTVFKMDASGNLTTLHSFAGSDGAYPYARLIQATDGNFYGTTSEGGASGFGTVFKMDASGNVTTLHFFARSDGANPYAGLIQATDGNFYGTTYGGAVAGTVFKMDASGNLTTIHFFAVSDGANPYAGLIQATDGNFYGTTGYGGANGWGNVFEMDASGNLTTLHFFAVSDGANPYAGLIQAADGNFYGTTYGGGAGGYGTVFRMDASGNLTTIHSFSAPPPPPPPSPTTMIVVAPATPDGSNGWNVSNVHASVTATAPGGSVVAETRCVLDPTSPPAIFGDIPAGCAFAGAGADVSSEGVHVLYAASKDVAGNVETPVRAAFRIDRTAPTVTCGPTPVFLVGSAGGSVSATVTDATSGPAVSSISAAVTAGDAATAGTKSKSLTGLDNAGNSTIVACAYVVEFATAGAVFNCAGGDVPCLIAAIDAANANPDADTINLAAGTFTLTAVNNGFEGTANGLPIISSPITIRGAGAEATIIERDPLPTTPAFRILQVAISAIFTLESLTIRNGFLWSEPSQPGAGGGGIYNGGATTIDDCVIAGNVDYLGSGGDGIRNDNTLTLRGSRVESNGDVGTFFDESDGGGIFNSGTLIVDHSSITGNVTGEFGGGIRNNGTATISDSTIAGNQAGYCGGILASGSTTITNSAIVGNRAFGGSGSGGIYVVGGLTIENSTIARNSSDALFGGGSITVASGSVVINNSTIVDNETDGETLDDDRGAGIANLGGTVQVRNTIVARNTFFYNEGTIESDCGGITSLGHNLFGSGCSPLASDLTGDPGLDAGQDDGTPGNSHYPLLQTSQAVDAGDPVSCTLTDQLGHSRIDGDRDGVVVCDIGAIEFSPAATIVSDLASLAQVVTASKRTPAPGGPAGRFTVTATFTNTSSTSIHDPVFKVTQLSGENLLLNADGGPGGLGATLTPDVGADRILAPGESFTTRFVVGLQHRSQFTFLVDLWGVAGP